MRKKKPAKLVEIACKAEPNAQLVSFLERMLTEAKSGDLQSLAAVGSYRTGETIRLVSGNYNIFTMCGMLELVKFDMLADFDG